MRLILDVRRRATEPVIGSLTTDRSDEPMRFEGWLDLMRLLETVIAEPVAPSPPDAVPLADERSHVQ